MLVLSDLDDASVKNAVNNPVADCSLIMGPGAVQACVSARAVVGHDRAVSTARVRFPAMHQLLITPSTIEWPLVHRLGDLRHLPAKAPSTITIGWLLRVLIIFFDFRRHIDKRRQRSSSRLLTDPGPISAMRQYKHRHRSVLGRFLSSISISAEASANNAVNGPVVDCSLILRAFG